VAATLSRCPGSPPACLAGGVLLIAIPLRKASGPRPRPPMPGPRALRAPAQLRRLHVIIPLDIAAGRLSYTISRQRRRKAQTAAERTNDPAAMTA
jgi:hypothetical protein